MDFTKLPVGPMIQKKIKNSTKQAKKSTVKPPDFHASNPERDRAWCFPAFISPSIYFATIFIFIVLILFLKSSVYMFNYEFCTRDSLPIPKVINLIIYTMSAYNKQDSTKEEKSLEEPQNPEPNSQWQSRLSSEAWPWTPPCLIINQELLSKGCLVLMIPKCDPADRLCPFSSIFIII